MFTHFAFKCKTKTHKCKLGYKETKENLVNK